ncbi:hypothetical protein FLL45_13610 [Aliikangiella marina]|uniref:Uncharacterized protein n=1 Tax=Aliikangiella marina TaxID=1712262 RepID=A0A545T9L0_9GAMM|nr:hypothetical protein [Aliikangiella marina]TQV73896.1 hypothetical protein FLL45_13610 [Aliikangiella marina]
MKAVLVILILLIPTVSSASDKPTRVDMAGILKMWGKEKPDAEIPGVSLFITGKAAEKLYKELKVEPLRNECFDDGTLTKYLGRFECSYSEKYQYSCSIGIGLSDQKLYYAESC